MQNTTTHQIFTVSKCRKESLDIADISLEKLRIFDISFHDISDISKTVRHFDTVILSMGVVILHYIKSHIQKLLITSDIGGGHLVIA